jgi:hypothetical protein
MLFLRSWPWLTCALAACAVEVAGEEPPPQVGEPAGDESQLHELAATSSVPDACGESIATLGWFSAQVPPRTGQLVAEVYAKVREADYQPVDMVLGFGAGEVDTFAELAANVRFNLDGHVDAPDGAAYRSEFPFRFRYDHLYAVRFEIDVPRARYSAYIRTYDTPGPGDSIATDYALRLPVEQLDGFAHAVDSPTGSLWACVHDFAP